MSDTIRQATLDDIPRWLEIAQRVYLERDVSGSKPWAEWHIKSPNSLVLIGRAGVGIASLDLHYGLDLRAKLDLLFSFPELQPGIEPVSMVRIMVRWAKSKGAQPPFLVEFEGGYDPAAIVKRLGGWKVETPRYAIPF